MPTTEFKGPFGMSQCWQKDVRPHPRAAGFGAGVLWGGLCVPVSSAQQELMRDCREGEQEVVLWGEKLISSEGVCGVNTPDSKNEFCLLAHP